MNRFDFKMYTLQSEFDRHVEHIVSYQGMQSGLPLFLVREFSTCEIFMQNDCFANPDFFIFLQLDPSKIDHISIEYKHILP